MVKKMNKSQFIEELVKQTKRDERDCIIISDCLEKHFFIGKKNKEKTVELLMEKLEVSNEEANEIYEISSNIIASAIKESLKHPFRSKD